MNFEFFPGLHQTSLKLERAARLLVSFCGLVLFSVPNSSAQISVAVSTDQPSYVLGEPVEITVTAVNSSPDPMTLGFGSALQSQYVLDNVYMHPQVGAAIPTGVTVPAHGTFDWYYLHRMHEFSLDIGSHEVIGRVLDVQPPRTSEPLTFDVTAPDPVTSNVLIDFESLPNGRPIILGPVWNTAYAAWGVRFHSDGGSLTFTERADGNTVLSTPTRDPASSFNIHAQFDMPVYDVSVDVGAAAERTVTMSAFDANGNLLGTVTSEPISAFPELVGPLEFSSHVPIASLQWLPSDPASSVSIDNLFLRVPEPSSLVFSVVASISLLATRRCRWHCSDAHFLLRSAIG